MNTYLKKALAMILCVILCLGAFPASALAEEEILSDVVEELIEVAEESVPSFEASPPARISALSTIFSAYIFAAIV